MLGPAEDEVSITRGGRDLGTRSTTLLPNPAVHATVDNLEVSAVDLFVQCAVRRIAGVNVRRDIATKGKPSAAHQVLQNMHTHVAYLNEPCTF